MSNSCDELSIEPHWRELLFGETACWGGSHEARVPMKAGADFCGLNHGSSHYSCQRYRLPSEKQGGEDGICCGRDAIGFAVRRVRSVRRSKGCGKSTLLNWAGLLLNRRMAFSAIFFGQSSGFNRREGLHLQARPPRPRTHALAHSIANDGHRLEVRGGLPRRPRPQEAEPLARKWVLRLSSSRPAPNVRRPEKARGD